MRLFCLGLLCCVTLALGCEDETTPKPPSASKNKILPLGASRVEGGRPDFESYRFELWKLLLTEDYEFDYIGTQTDRATYPGFADFPFDPDHEGRGGWTSTEILDGLDDWLRETGPPDIVLFSSPGGNDILGGGVDFPEIVANINAIIDLLQTANPEVTIIIEQLAPGMSAFMTAEFTDAFEQIQREVVTIAAQQTTATSRVLTIDMFTGFEDDLLADEVHYNEAGAKFIADRYYTILQDFLE
ncbi:MAG: GDSL-type esterase/lipase family protein [Bacteroidota bacterium]